MQAACGRRSPPAARRQPTWSCSAASRCWTRSMSGRTTSARSGLRHGRAPPPRWSHTAASGSSCRRRGWTTTLRGSFARAHRAWSTSCASGRRRWGSSAWASRCTCSSCCCCSARCARGRRRRRRRPRWTSCSSSRREAATSPARPARPAHTLAPRRMRRAACAARTRTCATRARRESPRSPTGSTTPTGAASTRRAAGLAA
mmetsp:Transcript_91197/g.273864  ORF Transcript_91197/g.273864 Transcript_91197/m.273864 type:complete len:202 (-) Transcript_91197:507-1112(-)